MRTTVDIPDVIYRQLKTKASSEGRSVRELIFRGVEGLLADHRKKPGKRISLPIVKSKRPGSLKIDNARISEIVPFP